MSSLSSLPSDLPSGVAALIPAHLGRQRWYAGSTEPSPDSVALLEARELRPGMWWVLVSAEGALYQLLLGRRPAGEPADFLSGREEALLGLDADSFYYDATLDPELALAFLDLVTDGLEPATRVRRVSGEQSNSSLVFDERLILKLYRRLRRGHNPDVEVTTALVEAGFEHVAHPRGVWREGDLDLAFAQDFLAGGAEGWALATTSLRDLYNTPSDDPGEAGGDFAAEAARLGTVTAQMHGAMAAAFGRGEMGTSGWADLMADIELRLATSKEIIGIDLSGSAGELIDAMRSWEGHVPAVRVHGDFHLGQVMRTDGGWYVLDFEGEPSRPLSERTALTSPLKDLAGMLRSFDYAAHFALIEHSPEEQEALAGTAAAWERRNRVAFLKGYLEVPEVASLLPDGAGFDLALAAFELDKALYELDYEMAYRPDWTSIPASALGRMLAEGARGGEDKGNPVA